MIFKKIAITITLIITITFAITSCHKKNTEFDYNLAIETVHDYVEAQQMTNLLLLTYFKAITDSTLMADSISIIDGAAVTLISDPSTMVFEYYNGAVNDGYGHTRSGRYTASTSSNFTTANAKVIFDFIKFTYDGDLITSNGFELTNGDLSVGFTFDVVASNINRDYGDTTGTIKYNIQETITITKDPSSPYHTSNDYFEVSGNNSGTARNDKIYSAQTEDGDKLVQRYSCNWMDVGSSIVELPEFIHNASVSFFNDGQCMNKYSITTNGTLFEKGYDVDY